MSAVESYEIAEDSTQVFRDEAPFAKTADFLTTREDKWTVPFGTYPTPKYTISFVDDRNELIFPLWIGANWIGIRYKSESYTRTLTQNELDSLKVVLGLNGN